MSTLTIKCCGKDGQTRYAQTGEQAVELNIESYQPGDVLVFESAQPFVWAKVHPQVKECMLYLPQGSYSFPVPEGEALRGFAPGTFEGKQTVCLRAATQEEVDTYRNLCLNPLDRRLAEEVVDPNAPEWSNPTSSKAIEQGLVTCFPHAYANRVTRNEGSFFARNAIDGIAQGGGHGDYPYHSWGGAVHEDLSFTVYFGREVEVDCIFVTLRSDYALNDKGQEHDTYWHTAIIEFSDGSEMEIHPQKTGDRQPFPFEKRKTQWVKFKRMDPFQTPKSENFAALNQFEVWGRG